MTGRQVRFVRRFDVARRRRARRRRSRHRVVVFGAKGFPQVDAAGGVERGVQHLTQRLARSGVGCLVYERSARRTWRREGRVLIRGLPFVDTKHHIYWSHACLSVLDYLAYRRRDDVVHVHSICNAWLCVLFRGLGHRVVFHLHGQEWRAAKWGPFMSWAMRLSIPMVLFADVVVTVCEDSRRLLANLFPWRARRIMCIPNGLPGAARSAAAHETVLADLGLARGGFFLCAGRLVPQKRVELIVQALAASGSRHSLIIAGAGSHSPAYVTMLEEEVRRCGVADRVHFVGQLDWERLLCLYADCRAVIHPSEHEGCSNTLLEAIDCHACVVCTDLPENRALLGDAGLYVAHGDVGGLAATLRVLDSDTTVAERQGMIEAQQRRLRTWDDIAAEFYRVYWPRQIDCGVKAPQLASGLEHTRSDAA